MKSIVITGGIGSGKSVVSRILMSMGLPVYDCDSRAKRLMDYDPEIIALINRDIGRDVVTPYGVIDRCRLAEVVFSDSKALLRLNSIVHRAVRDDIRLWIAGQKSSVVWIETAIAKSSGVLGMVDEEWRVVAPEELRVQRVMMRNGLTRQQVVDRIRSQQSEYIAEDGDKPVVNLINDDFTPILPRILNMIMSMGIL